MNPVFQNSRLAAGAILASLLLATACERRVDDIGRANPQSSETVSAAPDAPGGPPTVTDSTAANATSPAPADSGASGSSGTAGSGATSSVATTIDDTAITAKVKMALVADSDIKGLEVSVTTNNGEVMLGGVANNQTQIDRSAQIASAVEGVKGVENKIEIKK